MEFPLSFCGLHCYISPSFPVVCCPFHDTNFHYKSRTKCTLSREILFFGETGIARKQVHISSPVPRNCVFFFLKEFGLASPQKMSLHSAAGRGGGFVWRHSVDLSLEVVPLLERHRFCFLPPPPPPRSNERERKKRGGV